MCEHEKENLKDSKSRYNLRIIGEYVGSNALIAVTVFAISGFLLSSLFKLTMNKDVWFWFFSSIAQSFAALVGLVGLFLFFRLESYNKTIEKNIEIIRPLINELAEDNFCNHFTFCEHLFTCKIEFDKLDEQISRMEPILKNINKIEGEVKSDIKAIKSKFEYILIARREINELKIKKTQIKNKMRILLEHTVSIIILSIILIPFGSVNTEDSLMLALWNNFKLKWAFIFGVVGFCFASLYIVKSILMDFLLGEE